MPFKKALYRIPDIFLALLLSFSFVYALTSSLLLTYPAVNIFLLLLLFLIIWSVAFQNKTAIIITSSLATVSVIILFFAEVSKTGIPKMVSFIEDYFYWLSDFINASTDMNKMYQTITVLALCILLSLFVYIFVVKKYLFFILLTAGATIFVVQWSYNMMSNMVPFYVFLLGILMSYFKYIHGKRSSKVSNEYLQSGIYTLWILPVCIIVIFFASVMNFSDKPIQWKWLDTKINSVYNYINKQYDYQVFDYFSLSSSGFGSRDSLLGGRVRLDTTPVLKVKTPRNIYLRGSVRDIYTGTKWVNSSKETTAIGNNYKILLDDTSEMLQGMKLLTGKKISLDQYFYKDKVQVTFQNLKTKSIFIPSKILTLTPSKIGLNGITDINGSLSSTKRLSTGYSYSFELYSPKLSTVEFESALKKSSKTLYSDYLIKKDDVEKLNERSGLIYEKYTQLPKNVPQRVRDLANLITAPYDNDYDKVKAIEKYLATNYPYNLDVKSTPRNRDFVDYFLFDLKQGYCSYYASAMAVLTRCSGIPARYVEGYMLPPKAVKSDPSTFIVTNMQAHAWTEVYFEGYGWLPFEPTSPFRANFYSDATISSSVSGDYGQTYSDYMEMIKRYGHEGNDSVTMNAAETDNTHYVLIILGGILAIILVFILLLSYNLFKSRLKLYKIFNKEPHECILGLYAYFINILELQNLGLNPGETPYEYSSRIDGYMFFSPTKFKAVTDIFVKCRYSKDDMSEKEKLVLCDFHGAFISETRGYMGKHKYFLQKFILGKI